MVMDNLNRYFQLTIQKHYGTRILLYVALRKKADCHPSLPRFPWTNENQTPGHSRDRREGHLQTEIDAKHAQGNFEKHKQPLISPARCSEALMLAQPDLIVTHA